MNINALMQKAQSLQKEMQKTEEEVSKMIFTAKQPLVEVEVTGAKKVVSIKYSKDITADDMEILEDMTTLAINEALDKASKEMESRLSKYGQGLPGLF